MVTNKGKYNFVIWVNYPFNAHRHFCCLNYNECYLNDRAQCRQGLFDQLSWQIICKRGD